MSPVFHTLKLTLRRPSYRVVDPLMLLTGDETTDGVLTVLVALAEDVTESGMDAALIVDIVAANFVAVAADAFDARTLADIGSIAGVW